MVPKHRPDTPPPKALPKLPVVEWVPVDFRDNSWGILCPACRVIEEQPFPRSPIEADALRDEFAERHRGCSVEPIPSEEPKPQ